ncbi:hypothetical protein J2Y69_000388 [Microbacterium resistens]|uniref:Secreted protein n=1 Tax=Microbacterium resistens TaxID=156977 RepID=A0ABU1S870_9MICO|nr:hypothetical protein [Microbacterium resistens]MDR6865806.1 hypothetical protein [Microbacterium resistens]
MESTNNNPVEQGVAGRSFSRRAVVKTAAWSVPVIATAAAMPLASASVTPWNVSIDGTCVVDAGGTGLAAPGFLVKADSGTDPIPALLQVTENAAGTWSMTLPAPVVLGVATDPTMVPGAKEAFEAFALAYATAIVAAVLVPAAIAIHGPKVAGELWITPTSVLDYLTPPTLTHVYQNTGINRTVTLSCVWDINRDLTLNGLVPGDQTFWGYFGALVPPDVTGVPGFSVIDGIIQGLGSIPIAGPMIVSAWNTAVGSLSPVLELTATGQWTDAQDDHVGQVTNLFAFSC